MAKKQKSKGPSHKPVHVAKKQSYRLNNAKSLSLYNVHPMSTRQQSVNDKLLFLKSQGITGSRANQMVKCRMKLSKMVRQSKNGKNKSQDKLYKPKKWTQEVKLPKLIPSNDCIPWSITPTVSQLGTEALSQSPVVENILPSSWYNLSKSVVACFDHELKSFSEYVKLTPHEIAARDKVVEYVRNLSHTLWHDRVVIQQFGSFASPDVCTFQSDIDLALWNVVPPKEDDATSCSSSNSSGDDRYIFSEASGVVMSQSSLYRTMDALKGSAGSDKNIGSASKTKREKVEKWKKVLEEGDRYKSTNEVSNEANNDDCEVEKEKDAQDCLFVIDRVPAHVSKAPGANEEEKSTIHDDLDHTARYDSDGHGGSSEDDDDNVDKMNSYHQRQRSSDDIDGLGEVQDVKLVKNDSRTLSISSDDSSCYDERYDDDESDKFDLNISNHTDFGSSVAFKSKTIGPTGRTRTKVVRSLSLLAKHLWKSSFAQNIQVRRHARVPIICMTTKFGFDSDLALGGHNGMDTSQYVRKLIEKYDTFSTVVLFLKVLLQQMDLDKPFTGGLGSYKLYVLVANHFNAHKMLGGGESAAEMLLSFFYRYSTPTRSKNKARTNLSRNAIIRSEGGEADLSPVNVEACIELFQLCFQRLMDHLEAQNRKQRNVSFVASLIDVTKVVNERKLILKQAHAFTVQQDRLSQSQTTNTNGFIFSKKIGTTDKSLVSRSNNGNLKSVQKKAFHVKREESSKQATGSISPKPKQKRKGASHKVGSKIGKRKKKQRQNTVTTTSIS